MGERFDAAIHFGVVVSDEYLYEHYDPLGASLEEDSEWRQYEYTSEAFEAHVDRLAVESNLHVVAIGHYTDSEHPYMLALKEPIVETGYSDDYYAVRFDPLKLNVGLPNMHPEAVRIARALDLDWATAGWHLTWSVG
jgi:hypothetical protein